jgi:AraC-like DNA-binding protein
MKRGTQSRTWLMKAAPCLRPIGFGDQVPSHTSYGRCDDSFSTPLRIIYDHELIMYRNCICSIEFEDGEIICEPDTFIIIPPGKWHSEVCIETNGGCRYWCHFDWQFQSVGANSPVMTFATNKPHYELCHPAPDFVPPDLQQGKMPRPEQAYELAERLKSLSASGSHHEMLIAGTVLHELLIELLDEAPEEEGPDAQEGAGRLSLASRLRRSLDLAASQRHDDAKMTEALSGFNYSYEHLCRIFKAAYGISPLRYMRAQQITKAKTLLRNSELSISEICFNIGMNSPAYFAKTFRVFTGRTPSEYRNG